MTGWMRNPIWEQQLRRGDSSLKPWKPPSLKWNGNHKHNKKGPFKHCKGHHNPISKFEIGNLGGNPIPLHQAQDRRGENDVNKGMTAE
jgi:hypothetical protein